MDSPRETFPCNFLADQSDITEQYSMADRQPPPLNRAQRLRSHQAAAPRPAGAMTLSRVLHFGDSQHHDIEAHTASTSVEPWSATGFAVEQKHQSIFSIASTSIGILPCCMPPDSFIMRDISDVSHGASYIRSWKGKEGEFRLLRGHTNMQLLHSCDKRYPSLSI